MPVALRSAGKRPPAIIPVPVLSPVLSSYWLGLVTAVPANIARALIGGLKHNFSADDAALRQLVPQHLLGMEEAITAALQQERDGATAARWTEGNFALRGERHDVAFYARQASGSALTTATPEAVWQVLCSVGGETRYFAFNWLWTLREIMDWLVGGPGLTRGRRHPTDLRLGDAVDYWTVVGLEPARRLTLHFGMRAPGAGVLEFEIEPLTTGDTRITATAYWHPRGVWGLLYWYALVPAHLVVFRGMTRGIARLAEERENREGASRASPASHMRGPE